MFHCTHTTLDPSAQIVSIWPIGLKVLKGHRCVSFISVCVIGVPKVFFEDENSNLGLEDCTGSTGG
jgi:hypothetical protein